MNVTATKSKIADEQFSAVLIARDALKSSTELTKDPRDFRTRKELEDALRRIVINKRKRKA